MTDVQQTITVPASAAALETALVTMVTAIIENHKKGGGLAVEITADVMATVAAFSAAVAPMANIAPEATAEPILFAQALVNGAFTIAHNITQK